MTLVGAAVHQNGNSGKTEVLDAFSFYSNTEHDGCFFFYEQRADIVGKNEHAR